MLYHYYEETGQFLTFSSTRIFDKVFFILRAVRRATGFAYQHSFITFAILCNTSEACQRFGMFGRILSMQTTCNENVEMLYFSQI